MSRIAVIYLGRKGGGPVYAYEMTRGLIENGHSVYAFISKDVENLESWTSLKTDSTEIVTTFSSAKTYVANTIHFRLKEYKRLKGKYSSIEFDACYIPMGSFWDDMFINICGRPQLITTIHDPIWHSSDRNVFEFFRMKLPRLMLLGVKRKTPDDIVVLSNAFRDVTSKTRDINIQHVHVIPHGIFDFYKKVDSGKVYDYSKGKTNYLFLGRICGYKGIDDLAEAYKQLREKYEDVTLTIVGSGDFSEYMSLYDNLKGVTIINKWIPDEEMASYFKSNERVILVLPYKDGTQSGVIPTAMSFGMPIIATNTGGLSEQIQDGITGYLCNPGDPEGLALCMEKVMNEDTSEVVCNELEYIHSLDWIVLSRKIGEIINHENTDI